MISWVVRSPPSLSILLSVLAPLGAEGCRAAYAEDVRAVTAPLASAAVPAEQALSASFMRADHFRAWARESELPSRSSTHTHTQGAQRVARPAHRAATDALVALNALTCRGWKQRRAEAPLGECAQPMVDRVVQWSPDALVVLGGGLQLDGQANCATAERGFIAAQLFVALEHKPLLVFTGHASRWIRRRTDAADVQCIRARIAQGPLGEEVPQWAREQSEPEVNEPYAVSEAESLCAVMLRALPEERHAVVIARARFDVRAGDTVENARYTREFLVDDRVERALVVTSPFINPSNWRYYPHADRALHAFRGARREAPYALAALACPRSMKRDPWFEFEPVDGFEGPLTSRQLRAAQPAQR